MQNNPRASIKSIKRGIFSYMRAGDEWAFCPSKKKMGGRL